MTNPQPSPSPTRGGGPGRGGDRAAAATLRPLAKQMRAAQTPAETALWRYLRAGRTDGLKFVRQVPVSGYILDFAERSRKLAVEVDGWSHNMTAEADAVRTARLEALGWTVIRFSNEQVLAEPVAVALTVAEAARALPSPRPSPRKRGEGEG